MEKKANLITLHEDSFWDEYPLDKRVGRAYVERFGLERLKANLKRSFAQSEVGSVASLFLFGKMFLLQGLMFLSMCSNQSKGAHPPRSIVGKGKFCVDRQARFRFQIQDQEYPITIRHTYSQMNKSHPLVKAVKSLAINIESVFHCHLLSGESCPFFNVETFQAFLEMQRKAMVGESMLPYLEKHPSLWNAALSVPGPGSHSYLDLGYSSMMPYDEQKTNLLIKFFIVPQTDQQLSKPTQTQVNRFPDGLFHDQKDADLPWTLYEDDYRKQLSSRKQIHYTMYYQERPDNSVNRNAAFPWYKTPKKIFGTFAIDTILPDDGSSTFDIRVMPNTLFIPDASSCSDPKVIGHIRKTIYPPLQCLREILLDYGLFPRKVAK